MKIVITAMKKGAEEIPRVYKSVVDGANAARAAKDAFNRTMRESRQAMSGITGQIRTLIGAYAGFSALRNTVEVVQRSDQAIFNLKSSVSAANREFGAGVGTVTGWESAVKRLSGELLIYSDTALRNAISRTVDMTKRLGLSRDQMETVIKRSADLAAGKTDLEGGIERVTAALRGEAESAEYLGLTLNETYVMAWYEANKATEKAWKDLTDIERAQARYNVFLAQSEQLQGRAANSASTFGGALQLVKKEIENAITNNRSINSSLTALAGTLRDNAGEIGKMISGIVTAVGHVIEFAVEYRNLLVVIGGTVVAISLISRMVTVVKALHAAWTVAVGPGLVQWLTGLMGAINAVALSTGALAVAFRLTLAGAVVYALVQIERVTVALWDLHKANKELKKAQEDLARQKAFVDPQNAIRLKEISDATGLVIESFEELEELEKAGAIFFDNTLGEWAKSKEKPAGTTTTTSEEVKADILRLEEELSKELIAISGDRWTVLRNQAKAHYDEQVAMAHGNKALIAQAEKIYGKALADIATDQQTEATEARRKLDEAGTKAQIDRLKAATSTQLAEMASLYAAGKSAAEKYFADRKAAMDRQYQDEAAAIRKLADAETDPAKKIDLESQLYALEQQHRTDLIRLADEQAEAEARIAENRRQAEEILADIRNRAQLADDSVLSAKFSRELAEMDQRHAEEIKRLTELKATKEQLDDAYINHKIEKERLLADQEKRIWESKMEAAEFVAAGMSETFAWLYSQTGEKVKAFFYLQKTAAIAEAVIQTELAAAKALGQTGIFGIPMSTLIRAQGMLRVAAIAAQRLAVGGMVTGSSPHEKADNVPVMATAGEFMQPVSAVKYYGVRVMEAIREKAIPRDIFANFALPAPRMAGSYALADGGQVPGGGWSVTVPVTVNAESGNRLAGRLQSEIESTVIRVMREEMR